MVRILYGVAGEGMGHAVRSKAVLEHLKKRHEVRIVAAAKAYEYLSNFFEVTQIDYFDIIYRNNRVSGFLTVLNNLMRSPLIIRRSWKIHQLIKEFKPDLIITDFEPFVDYFALFNRVPVISIDNQHLITEANHDAIVKGQRFSLFCARLIVALFTPKRDCTFILSIVPAESNAMHFHIIDPILRTAIRKARSLKGRHILVYQTSMSNADLIPTLKKFSSQQFILYGLGGAKRIGNLTFKTAKEAELIDDLRRAKAVITNGGFTMISEAIHLKKPILTIPVKNHFEQFLNAMHVHMSGFGMYAQDITEMVVQQFLENQAEYVSYLNKQRKYSNKRLFRLLEMEIRALGKKTNRHRA